MALDSDLASAPQLPLASPWRRLCGYLIDCGLFSPLALAVVVWASIQVAPAADKFANSPMGAADIEAYVMSAMGLVLPLALWSTALSALFCLYYIVCLGVWGRTLGGQFLSLRCVSLDGSSASWPQVLKRQLTWFAFFLSGLLPVGGGVLTLVNYLWMLGDPNKQTLMDKVAKTTVVNTRLGQIEAR